MDGLHTLITKALRSRRDYQTPANGVENTSSQVLFLRLLCPSSFGMTTLSHILCFILNLVTFVCFSL